MKSWLIVVFLLALPVSDGACSELNAKVWNHGAPDCARNVDPAIEVHRHDPDTYILRQSKCVHFEAPFVYVLLGEHTAFVLDTGATADAQRFPLYKTVRQLIAQRQDLRPNALSTLVVHSHSHGDHTAADVQFRGQPQVTLIEPTLEAVRAYFGFAHWPIGPARIDLGGRELVVVPAPGHQDESIAVYDARTNWLLTGDSLYPGRIVVKDWSAYRASIHRLAEFSKNHSISAIMGAHIEMSTTPGLLFPAESTYQPNETDLALALEELLRLDDRLQRSGVKAQEIATAKFVITPLGRIPRVIGTVLKWMGVR